MEEEAIMWWIQVGCLLLVPLIKRTKKKKNVELFDLKAFSFSFFLSWVECQQSRGVFECCVIIFITTPYWFFHSLIFFFFVWGCWYRQPFPSGERVTFTGKEVLCPKCVQIPVMTETPSPPMKPVRSSPTPSSPASNGGANTPSSTTRKFFEPICLDVCLH